MDHVKICHNADNIVIHRGEKVKYCQVYNNTRPPMRDSEAHHRHGTAGM